MSRIPPQGARLVGAWPARSAPSAPPPASAESVWFTPRRPSTPSARHPHVVSLLRHLHLAGRVVTEPVVLAEAPDQATTPAPTHRHA